MLQPSPPARVLVADDDPVIRSLIVAQLASARYTVSGVGDVAEVEAALTTWAPDIVVLDLSLPDGDGLDLCRRLRAQGQTVLIIMVTARSGALDRVLGLELGADDYLTKPFEPRELVARVNNLARRLAQPSSPATSARVVRFGAWRLDRIQRRLVDADGGLVLLSAAEFRLLSRFIAAPQQVLSREALLPERRETVAFDRSLDIQISRLRQKLERQEEEALILTVRNEGYLFTAAVSAA